MKKNKKLLALITGTLVSASMFIGCSANEQSLYNAYNKSATINSLETKTDITLNVSATNLSANEQQALSVFPLINSSTLDVVTKSKTNQAQTSGQAESDVNLQLMGSSINTNVWVNSDLSASKPVIKEIASIPSLISSTVPEFKGKDYLVLDYADAPNTQGNSQVDYSSIAQLSTTLKSNINAFTSTYIKQYNPNLDLVNKLNSKNIIVSGKTQHVTMYELKLNDKNFKDLLKYTVKNVGDNKDTVISFIKEYLSAVSSVNNLSGTSNVNDTSIQNALDNITTQWPQIMSEISNGVNTLDDVAILGSKGITIDYAVNDDGYIVNENGSIQFIIDTPAINKLSGNESTAQNSSDNGTGIYTVTLNYNTDTYNINGNESIVFPTTNSSNSVNYFDLLKETLAPAKTQAQISSQVNIDYQNAYAAVQKVITTANNNNVKPALSKFAGSLDAGVNNTQDVINAANNGLQSYINAARDSINKLPDSLKNSKETFSYILDNYEQPIFETTSSIINNNKTTPKQSEIIGARTLIKDFPANYKSSYSTALDAIQQNLLTNADQLVSTAVKTKAQADIAKAKQSISDLKTIPSQFSSQAIDTFIQSLQNKIN